MTRFLNVAERDRQPEVMDQPNLDEREHYRALQGLATINWFSRSAAIIWPSIAELSRQLNRPIHILDVACGGGDVAISLWQKCQSRKIPATMAGCDISLRAVEFAKGNARKKNAQVSFFCHDILQNELSNEYDVVMCSLFLHHLSESDAIVLLQRMADATRHTVLVNDLCRSNAGLMLAILGSHLLSRSPVVHTDAPLSVRAAFTMPEVLLLAQQANLAGGKVGAHWPFRFLFSWKK